MEYEKPESLSIGRTKKVGKVIKKIGDTSNTEEENRCGIRQTGAFLTGAAPNGLFGLGIENISAQSMLASKGLAANSFSMCFGPDGIGRIVFGDKGSPGQGETLLNLDQPYPTYNISLTGITVGSKITDFDFRAIFNSSTSFTYLNDPVYKVITENMSEKLIIIRPPVCVHPERIEIFVKGAVLYHPGKANVVADALSRLSMGSVAHVEEGKKELARDVHQLACLGVCLTDTLDGGVIV
ncbi:hypothetical protein MTR67_001794 [Solanum verrucosum]|uniref:Peptidase A1 domain-containing protein n=1 Tax=Solanum verrucosum TaxID=315347 RepID=A0AAF0T863_SOLVR|nr:hypothetical protein MTR67_001794 [Solanum verrucosum]